MRVRGLITLGIAALSWACGSESGIETSHGLDGGIEAASVPDAAGGFAGEAGAAGSAGQVVDAGPDAAGQAGVAGHAGAAGGSEDAGSDALQSCEDAGSPAPLPLTADELDLIFAADPSAPMDIVTNVEPEDDAFLHTASAPIDPSEAAVQHLIARMRATLAATSSGVGLAAPQVRIHRRLFLAARTDKPGAPVEAFLNPLITEYSTELGLATEGCLSVPSLGVAVSRSKWVRLDYDIEAGDRVCAEVIGSTTDNQAAFAARIVQHEYDHLNGILIVDD